MKQLVLFFALASGSAFAQAKTCDFRLQSCIREGEMISTTWAGSTPNTCYTRSGDSLVPDPCTGQPQHVEPSAAYLKALPSCCREFPQPQELPYKKTGAECKVNPESQRGFVCKQKK